MRGILRIIGRAEPNVFVDDIVVTEEVYSAIAHFCVMNKMEANELISKCLEYAYKNGLLYA